MKFRELLEECNIPVAPEDCTHQTEGWVQFDCPFCEKNTGRYHMGYNTNGGFINCWRCGGHSLASVLQEYTGFSYSKVKKLTDDLSEGGKRVTPEKTETVLRVPSCVNELRPAHIRYLQERGFDYKEIQRLWQIKGTGIVGRLRWRLFIPIMYRNKTVSWTTRSLRDAKDKYISAGTTEESIPHKNILYGMDFVRHSVIITEGPLDVWAIGPGAVATFGTAFTKQQVIRLLNTPRRIVCYDNDKEAQKQARKLCDVLGAFGGETINVVLDSGDPGEATNREIKKLRKFLE